MLKNLIQLIKNSHLVTITGPIGSGKSLLLTKLAHHTQLGGTIIASKEQLTSLSPQGNVFIDNYWNSLDKQDYQQIIKNQRKVIFCSQRFQYEWIRIRDQVDLIIRAKGVKQRWWFGWEKYLQLEVYHDSLSHGWENCETIDLPLTRQDLTRLNGYCDSQRKEYHKTITEQRNSLNNSEIRI